MRRLVTGRSCRLSSRRSLALRPRLSAGLPCFRPDPVTANLAADDADRTARPRWTPMGRKYRLVLRRITCCRATVAVAT